MEKKKEEKKEKKKSKGETQKAEQLRAGPTALEPRPQNSAAGKGLFTQQNQKRERGFLQTFASACSIILFLLFFVFCVREQQ